LEIWKTFFGNLENLGKNIVFDRPGPRGVILSSIFTTSENLKSSALRIPVLSNDFGQYIFDRKYASYIPEGGKVILGHVCLYSLATSAIGLLHQCMNRKLKQPPLT